jgi:hypothetical protein
MRARLTMSLIVLMIVSFAACKKRQVSSAAEVAVSPVSNPSSAPEVAVSGDEVLADDEEERYVARVDEADASVADQASGSLDGARSADPVADGGEPLSEEEVALRARQRTEAALDKQLEAAFDQMRRCFAQGGLRREITKATLRFRLHRSGYLVNPDVDAGDREVNACLVQVLDQVRVAGVETDSLSIERTVELTPGVEK